MINKQISNLVFMKTKSYKEFQSIFVKYYESSCCFLFNNNLLKFIAENNYFQIFEFLSHSGRLFDSQSEKHLTNFFRLHSDNQYSEYFKHGTLKYVMNYSNLSITKTYPLTFENKKQWLNDDLIFQKYIVFQTINNEKFSTHLEEFIIEKIKLSEDLSSCLYYFVKISKSYNLRFIKSLLDHNLLNLNIEEKIFIFQENQYFIDLMKNIIDNNDNFKSICIGLENICNNNKHIPIHIFDYIMNNGDLKLILKLNEITFSKGHIVKETIHYDYDRTINEEIEYIQYDYSILLSYLTTIFNSKYLSEIVSKRYFIFNKEFFNISINQKQIQFIFDQYIDFFSKNSYKFFDKLFHLEEKIQLKINLNHF